MSTDIIASDTAASSSASNSQVTDHAITKAPEQRLRLEFLDGLRGLAALYVVIDHACQLTHIGWSRSANNYVFFTTGLPPALLSQLHWLEGGHFSVVVFIVLSGYCLTLPIAQSGNRRLRGGIQAYIQRRAWRILPPYYAAMFVCLIMLCVIPEFQQTTGRISDAMTPAFKPDVLVSHVLLFHNLSMAWTTRINGVFWSVATEWQIYFVFPTLLLPAWRRLGATAAVVGGLALGMFLHYMPHGRFDIAAPWLVGLFSLGMAGAIISFAPETAALRNRIQAGWLIVLGGCIAYAVLQHPKLSLGQLWLQDYEIGIAAVFLVIACAHLQAKGSTGASFLVLHLLKTPGVVWLGTISYSLYLIHYPVLVTLDALLHRQVSDPIIILTLLLLSGIPLSIAVSWIFHLGFERPFLSNQIRQVKL